MNINESTITHFSVGNGNCCLIKETDFVMIIDLNKTEEAISSYDMLKPYFRTKDGKSCIDVLVITHGDEDHCLGFKKFQEEIDAGNLVIGEIWHQGFDRTVNQDEDKLPEDYLSLKEEIERREDIEDAEFGDVVAQPKAKNTDEDLFEAAEKPEELGLKVLSPFDGDDEASDYDHNDLSIVMNIEFHGMKMLFASDSSGVYWQDKIIPDLLDDDDYSDYAEAETHVGSHHGSYTFFGKDRDELREADPEPDNYEALDKINSDDLIISAKEQFPTSGDSSGDDPPHYAAYRWYHKWFRDNHDVKEDDKHPDNWHYTSDGTVRLEYEDDEWKWIDDYEIETEDEDDDQEEQKQECSHVQESKNGMDKEKALRDLAIKISSGTAATDSMGRVKDVKEVGGRPNPVHRSYGGEK